jgi:hypothetical protein
MSSKVQGVIGMIGKVFICAMIVMMAYFVLLARYSNAVEGFAAPLVVTLVLAWIVTSMFMEVIGTGVDTIIQCFITGTC